MSFNILAAYLPAGATAAGLETYSATLPASLYATMLAVPVTGVTSILNSLKPTIPSPPTPPSAPPDVAVMSVVGMAPGVVIAIVLPIVAVIVIAGVGGYWYRQRHLKRIPQAQVQPQGQAGAGQLLVQPPDLPDS